MSQKNKHVRSDAQLVFLESSSSYFPQSTAEIVTLHPESAAKFFTTTSPLSCHNGLVLDT